MGNKIKKFLSGIWEGINQIDVPDGVENLTKAERAEVNNANEVQKKVHQQRSFVPRAKVNEAKAKAMAEEIDPVAKRYESIRPIAERMNKKEKDLREGR